MKKAILLFLMCSLFTNAFSQEKKKQISFGLKTGITMSTLSPDVIDNNATKHDFSFKQGFTFGGRVEIAAGKNFLIMPEACIVGKGAKNNRYYGNTINVSPTLSGFFEITPNLVLQVPSKTGNFRIGGGPSVGFNLDHYRELVNHNDWGINTFIAYQLPIGFSFEINFNKGFRDQSGGTATSISQKNTTSVLGFCVGYTF
jgi:hypothetical protein